MTKHTPGPWEWWTSCSWRRLLHSNRGVSTNVLYPTVHPDGQADIDVSQADMNLIAAAPDMLNEAKAVCWFDWSDNDPDACAAIDGLRAAIAKAEGAS